MKTMSSVLEYITMLVLCGISMAIILLPVTAMVAALYWWLK